MISAPLLVSQLFRPLRPTVLLKSVQLLHEDVTLRADTHALNIWARELYCAQRLVDCGTFVEIGLDRQAFFEVKIHLGVLTGGCLSWRHVGLRRASDKREHGDCRDGRRSWQVKIERHGSISELSSWLRNLSIVDLAGVLFLT